MFILICIHKNLYIEKHINALLVLCTLSLSLVSSNTLFTDVGILQQAISLPECASICSFCSRMKRGRLYSCARREGYNVLAMGQHLDDLSESFLMSAFHNGFIRTMKANYTVK